MSSYHQNIVYEWADDDEIGQKLVENEDTIGSYSMQEGSAREKLVNTENWMVYEITRLYKIRRMDSMA